MVVFWIVAGALAAGAAALVLIRAAAAARAAALPGEDPALPIYRRQLAELEELSGRGLLGPEERRAAEAEAGRRLLSAADQVRGPEAPGGGAARVGVLVGVGGAALTALLLYLALGSPGLPDQPYSARLKAWRAADPATLTPDRMAAVLREIVAERPRDPEAYAYLGRAEMTAGDDFAAARAFERAAALAPNRADLFSDEGQALTADADGQVTPEAAAAFRRALALDPKTPAARFYLARARIAGGDVQGGLADWRALAADLDIHDPRRQALLAEIAAVSSGGASALDAATGEPPPSAAALGTEQMVFVRAMVARQAAALKANPNDADGWARLIRSYGVLGDRAAQGRAMADVQRIFAGHPDDVARIEAEAKKPVSAAGR